MIVATGLALLAGCATTGKIQTSMNAGMPKQGVTETDRPTEGVIDTGQEFTSVACARNYGDFNMAKAEAEALAQGAILEYVGASEGRIVGSRFENYWYDDPVIPNEICVEISVPYWGVR